MIRNKTFSSRPAAASPASGALGIFAILLAGCQACSPSATPSATPLAPAVAPAASAGPAASSQAATATAGQCPRLEGFRVASNEDDVTPGPKRWLLHEKLLDRTKELPDGEPSEHVIADAEARALGASSSDAPVWIVNHGAAPCRMKPAGFVLQLVDWGPRFQRVARVLEGTCAYPGSSGRAIAFQQPEEPSLCRSPIVSEMSPMTLPEGLVPTKACAAPGCRYDTRHVGGTIAGGAAVLSVIATWLHPTKEAECSWEHEDFFGVFVKSKAGGPLVAVPGLVRLEGALTDDRGLVAVVGDALWTMTVVPVVEGQPRAAVVVTTHVAHEEDNEWNSLAPYCGP